MQIPPFIVETHVHRTLKTSWWQKVCFFARPLPSTTHDQHDWRTLSPSQPPLPILKDEGICHSREFPVDVRYPKLPWSSFHTIHQPSPSSRRLYPIPEEDDSMSCSTSSSPPPPPPPPTHNTNTNQWQKRTSTPDTPDTPDTSDKLDKLDVTSTASVFASASTSTSAPASVLSSTGSSSSYTPPIQWPLQQKSEPEFSPAVVNDENKCKQKFAKMVQAACQYYLEHTTTQPIPMDIVFNMSDNVRHIRLFHTNGTTAFQVFCGNPQYIPPEIFLGATYKHGLADVWVLGISLYRMLVGKYPFIASTDRGLFKKMLKGDFSIPNHFSDDVKDLLRRMLAPDTARASLDLVMFHQWLKPYSVGVPATAHSSALVEPPTETAKANAKAKAKAEAARMSTTSTTSAAGTEPEMETKTEKLKKKSLMTGGTSTETAKPSKPAKPAYKKRHILRRLLVLIFQGPCPPPKQPYREFAHFGRTNPPA